jgi:hypothetical protein
MRKDDEAQRQHPEAENGKKTEKSAEYQENADQYPRDARSRHGDA